MSDSNYPNLSPILPDEAEDLKSLSVVIPVYNSEETIGSLIDLTVESLDPLFERLEIILVNDGSVDRSHLRAREAECKYPGIVKYIRLARNFGEHNAVICGLHYVTCDCAAVLDDDFQNPPQEIVKLVEKLRQGYDVVYSYYDRKHHPWFRNLGSSFTDRVATWVIRKPRGLYLSSFKVMNRFLVSAITDYTGPYPYIDGLILRATTSIGRQLCEHSERKIGRSNYTLRRLIRLWLNMFTSSSLLPLRLASVLGFLMSLLGLFLAAFFTLSWATGGILATRSIPPGWASLIVCVTFFSGLQMCLLGVIGEYLGRLFLSQNRSPQFVVRRVYGFEPPREKEAGHGDI
jgi:undecaprenyl-phosphate 4-deoxy-4-formamido-L-arabinose transferase